MLKYLENAEPTTLNKAWIVEKLPILSSFCFVPENVTFSIRDSQSCWPYNLTYKGQDGKTITFSMTARPDENYVDSFSAFVEKEKVIGRTASESYPLVKIFYKYPDKVKREHDLRSGELTGEKEILTRYHTYTTDTNLHVSSSIELDFGMLIMRLWVQKMYKLKDTDETRWLFSVWGEP